MVRVAQHQERIASVHLAVRDLVFARLALVVPDVGAEHDFGGAVFTRGFRYYTGSFDWLLQT